jgi:hypothetical protein
MIVEIASDLSDIGRVIFMDSKNDWRGKVGECSDSHVRCETP